MKKKIGIGLGIGVLILVLLVAAISFRGASNKEDGANLDMGEAKDLPVVQIDQGRVESVVYALGKIENNQRQEVRSEISDANIVKIYVQEGQRVETGDILFDLEDTMANLAYEQEKLDYRIKERDFQKEKELVDKTELVAPLEGKIVEVLVGINDEVDEDMVVMKIVQQNIFEVKLPFNVTDAERFTVGDTVPLTIMGFYYEIDSKVVDVERSNHVTESGGVLRKVTFQIKNPGALQEGDEVSLGTKLKDGVWVSSLSNGKLAGIKAIEVKAAMKGNIDRVSIEKGDYVYPGDFMMSVDASVQSENLLDKELALELSRIQLREKEEELEKYHIRAEVSGVVDEIEAVVGKEPPSDLPAMVVSNEAGLEMVVQVEEQNIANIEVGQKAEIYLKAFGDKKILGSVASINEKPLTSGEIVVFEVSLKLENSEDIKAGMSGDADIYIDSKEEVLRIPIKGIDIVYEGSGNVMLKNETGGFELREISIGLEGQRFIEVVAGLELGDEIQLFK